MKTFELKIKTDKYGCPTLGPINYSSSCMSDGSLETDFLLQKMVSDGEFSLDDFRKLCIDSSEVQE